MLLFLSFASLTTNAIGANSKGSMSVGPTGIVAEIKSMSKDINERYFSVKNVEKGSPAEGKLQPGDIIIGAGKAKFSSHIRSEMGAAIAMARTTKGKGDLTLFVQRSSGGKAQKLSSRPTTKVSLKLSIAGPDTFNATAPYNCPKVNALIQEAAEYIIEKDTSKNARTDYPNLGSKLQVNLLGLLATGEEKYTKFVATQIHKSYLPKASEDPLKLARLKAGSSMYSSWFWAYKLILYTEYYLLTKDKAVLPAIRQYAEAIADGQDAAGLWGHRMHDPRTMRAFGYGVMNQPSTALFMSLILARKCGVDSPRISAAIERTNNHYKTKYLYKGTLPYGNHDPNNKQHNNTGMSALIALAYAHLGEVEAARFYTKMTMASHGSMESGHASRFFNLMWTGLGANIKGLQMLRIYWAAIGSKSTPQRPERAGPSKLRHEPKNTSTAKFLHPLCRSPPPSFVQKA